MNSGDPICVLIYELPDGKEPLTEWLETMKDRAARAKIRIQIGRLQNGNPGHCRSVGQGLFELKINFGPGYRVYFGIVGQEAVLLLCGGDKKSQDGDIQIARSYWSDYCSRRGEQA